MDLKRRIILLPKVAGVAVVFEVQRSSKSEARKEGLRKQELEAEVDFLGKLSHPNFGKALGSWDTVGEIKSCYLFMSLCRMEAWKTIYLEEMLPLDLYHEIYDLK